MNIKRSILVIEAQYMKVRHFQTASHIDDINFRIYNLCQTKGFEEIEDVIQRGVHMATIIAHGTHSQLNFLPFVIGTYFSDGRIELGFHFIDHAPNDFSFPLKGPIVKKEKLHLQNTHHHRC